MHKYDEFEIAFKRLYDIDISRLKKENDTGVKYFLGDVVFFVLNNGSLLVSSEKGKVYLNFSSWETRINVLKETSKTILVFISVGDTERGVECCYESELEKI